MKRLCLLVGLLVVASSLAACTTPAPEVVEKVVTQVVEKVVTEIVEETVIVEGTPEVVEKEVTRVVEVETVVTATPEPEGPKVLNIGPNFDAKGLSPDLTNFWTVFGVVENLTTLDYDGELAPALATDWEMIGDETWEFTLREGVTFHNGEPFNADVAVSALNRYFGLETAATALRGATAVAKDGYAIEITTLDHNPFLPQLFTDYTTGIMHPDAYDADGAATDVIGTGPYEMVEWIKDEHATLAKFADYWGGEPKIDTINLLRIPDTHTRATMLKTGELDIVEGIPIADAVDLGADPTLQIFITPQTRYRVVYLNNSAPPFDDVRVRQAINYAIDREALVEYVLEGYGSVAQAPFIEVLPWGNPDIQGYEYDPEQARALLEDAGQEGLEFSLMTYSSRAELPLLAQAIQAQLADIGVTVDVQVTEYSALSKAVSDKDFDSLMIARGPLYGGYDPTTLLSSDYTTDGNYNWSLYYNEEFDARLAEAQSTDRTLARYAICQELEQELVDQAVDVFLNYYVGVYGAHDNVAGYAPHPLEFGSPMHLIDIQ